MPKQPWPKDDKAQEPEGREISAKEFWSAHRREICAGMLVVLVVLIAGATLLGRLFFAEKPKGAPKAAASIGMVDIRDVLAAHPDYQRLQQLKGEALRLELSLKSRARLPVLTVPPPQTDSQPFDDSVWQKNAQTVIGGRVSLQREEEKVRAEWVEKTKGDYEARRDAMDAEYLNAILNLNMKLDNQKQMNHPWTSEEELAEQRAGWEAELHELKMERGARQMALKSEWEAQVEAQVAAVMAPRIAAWEAEARQTLDQQQAAALKAQTDAQARNAGLMEQQMMLSMNIQMQLQERSQLEMVRQMAAALETHIYNDIMGKAAKIAIMHHFTMILATPMASREAVFPGKDTLSWQIPAYGEVVGTGTEDVTGELVAELKALPPKTTDTAMP